MTEFKVGQLIYIDGDEWNYHKVLGITVSVVGNPVPVIALPNRFTGRNEEGVISPSRCTEHSYDIHKLHGILFD